MKQLWGYTQPEQAAPGKYVVFANVLEYGDGMYLGMRDELGRHVKLKLTTDAAHALIKALGGTI